MMDANRRFRFFITAWYKSPSTRAEMAFCRSSATTRISKPRLRLRWWEDLVDVGARSHGNLHLGDFPVEPRRERVSVSDIVTWERIFHVRLHIEHRRHGFEPGLDFEFTIGGGADFSILLSSETTAPLTTLP